MNPRTATLSRGPGRGAANGAAAGIARRALAGVLRTVARRPGAVLGFVAVVGGTGVFGWNVLMTQTMRHPAPLFAPAKPVVPTPPDAPRRQDGTPAPPLPVPRPDPAAAPVRAGTEASSRAPASQDPIGAMIRSSDPQAPRPAAEARPGASPRLAAAQKALVKLGYGPIGIDGVMGSTTRQALERFERDRSLPVTGALGPRTAKQLAAASGLSLE